MKVATGAQMKQADGLAMASYGIPGIVLMENAAIQAAGEIASDYGSLSGTGCVVLCGKGNNGGDGFAIARHLDRMGAKVELAFFYDDEVLTGDARTNYDIAKRIHLSFVTSLDKLGHALNHCDFIVDSLYGIAFHGALRVNEQAIVNMVNQSGKRVYAIDMPSGINADTGIIEGEPVRATKTITFTAYKPAQFLFPAADYCGEVILKDIGIPTEILQKDVAIETIEKLDIAALLPRRERNTHKGDYGKVMIAAGSRGMSGAAYLCATSAAKSGAGLVTVGVPECIHSIMEVKTTEVMTAPLPDDGGALAAEAAEIILQKAGNSNCLLFGPGVTRKTQVIELLERLISECSVPLIIDADGLNTLSERLELLKKRRCPVILTPHSAEMARLAGKSVQEVESDRIGTALAFASQYGVTLILKGAHTVVATCEGAGYINCHSGNAGMATGGSGDVLGGVLSALIAGGLCPSDAAKTAVFVHGLAGDIAAKHKGLAGLTACDIMESLPEAFQLL